MKCSIVILNWNGAQMLQDYLPSVIRHSQYNDCEVVVVDNGSTDATLDTLSKINKIAQDNHLQEARVVLLDKNYGYAEGYNKALEQIDSEYTILLNSDVEVTAGWLEPMLSYMDAHPDVVACQPKILSWKNKQYFEYAGAAGGFIDHLCYPYCRGRILGTVEADKGQYDQIIDIFWASGACLCVRTRAYLEIGGLDAAFFAHMEEIDLCWRLLSRGHRIVCIPQSSVYHLGGGSLNYENPKKTFLNFRNSLLMIYKNMPADRLTSTLGARFFLDIAASLHYLVTGKLKNAWAVLQAWCAYLRMRSQFTAKRNHNLGKTTCAYPNTMSKRIILFDYYFRSLRTWSK
jgi:GT2 family glycosyltransferase